MPLPTLSVVPAGWSKHHRPVSEGGMNAECVVSVPGSASPSWDGEDYTTPTRQTLYAGKCRVQADFRAQKADQSEQETAERRYSVALPATFEPAVGSDATVRITKAPNDSALVGRALYVVSDQYGSEAFERILECTDTFDLGAVT